MRWFALNTATLLMVIFFTDTASSMAADGLKAAADDDEAINQKKNAPLISFWNVGTRHYNEHAWGAPFYMRPYDNWRDFIREQIEPEYAWGCRRWLLHNPAGTKRDGTMDFDQFLRAADHGHPELVDDFAEAWGEFMAEHPDVEVIVYLGQIGHGPAFEAREDDVHAWLSHALDAIEIPLKLNMSIAFDAVSGFPEGHRVHRFVQLVEAMGVRTYIEAWPRVGFEHWMKHSIMVTEWNYRDRAMTDVGVPTDQAAGEVVRMVTERLPEIDGYRDVQGLARETKSVLQDGHSVAVPLRRFVGTSVDPEELMGQ